MLKPIASQRRNLVYQDNFSKHIVGEAEPVKGETLTPSELLGSAYSTLCNQDSKDGLCSYIQ